MAVVRVPKVPSSAYNAKRPVSDLLKTQIRELQAAVLAAVDTEGEAARCIEVLTGLLQEVRPQLTPTRHGGDASPRRRRVTRGPKKRKNKRKAGRAV